MKNEDLLLYGGIAVLAYLFLKPTTVAPGVTQVAPVTSALPASANSNVTNQLLTAGAGLAPVLAKLFTSPSTPSAASAAPAASATAQGNAAGNTAAQQAVFQTPALTAAPAPYVAPGYTSSVPTYDSTTDTSYLNATVPDYTNDPGLVTFDSSFDPSATMSGVNAKTAARIGEY